MIFSRTLRLLLVEDHPSDQAVIMGMLLSNPYGKFDVQTAGSLRQIHNLSSCLDVDVILLDLNIEDSRGLDTLGQVTALFPETAIVVNTGAFEDDLGLQAVTMGAQDYLIKGMYKVYGLVKSLHYAVERKKAEQDLKKALADLQEAQSQLIRVEKMNIVGGVASGVAHEVKNPLTTILYGVEYLYTVLTDRDEKIERTLSSMREAVRKANQIITDLLDFASISNLKPAEHPIERVVEQALNLTYHQCEKFNIQVVKDFQTGLPRVMIDSNRVEQVMVDILLNAVLAMGCDGVLTVRAVSRRFDPVEDAGHTSRDTDMMILSGAEVLVVDFDDTGPGINPEHADKIFDPFFTTRRAAGGVGLGLSVSRTIMRNHGGIIYVGNRPGGGARARLIFPVHHG